MDKWKFYVYELFDLVGVKYVGKGSGARLRSQIRKYGLCGREIARFKREKDALNHEKYLIKSMNPVLNKTKGGEGCRKKREYTRKYGWELEIERIGTREYARRILMRCGVMV